MLDAGHLTLSGGVCMSPDYAGCWASHVVWGSVYVSGLCWMLGISRCLGGVCMSPDYAGCWASHIVWGECVCPRTKLDAGHLTLSGGVCMSPDYAGCWASHVVWGSVYVSGLCWMLGISRCLGECVCLRTMLDAGHLTLSGGSVYVSGLCWTLGISRCLGGVCMSPDSARCYASHFVRG